MATRGETVDAILGLLTEMAVARAMREPSAWLHVDLTMAQLKAIFLLRHHGALRVGPIGELLGLSPNAITGVLDRLEERGLVRRRADALDRRAVLVELLPAGEALFEQLQAAGVRTIRRRLEGMATGDLEALHRGMSALLVQVREEIGESGPAAATGAAKKGTATT